MQPTAQQALVDDMREAMLELYGSRLSSLILYGSYARADFHAESDIDFLVVLDKPELDYGEEVHRIAKVIYPLMLDHDIIISCLPSPLPRWQTEQSFFFDQIKKDGIALWTREPSES